ncbi:MAG: hypothetical protein WKF85_03035 [Chitinophagaceae bacterium]
MERIALIHKYLNDFEIFRKTEEFLFYIFLKENRTHYSILRTNFYELLKAFDHHNDPSYDNIIWQSKPNIRWKLQREIIRLLSNYLSSIYWMVNFSRKKQSQYLSANPNSLNQFELDKITNFKNNATHQFVQDLRNFVNHEAFLKITSIKSSSIEKPEIERNIYISREQLLNSSFNWKSQVKDFIKAQEEKIYIIDILQNHFHKFSMFQNKVYKKIICADIQLTQNLILQLEDFIDRAMTLQLSHILPFNQANIRYLKYISKL